MSASEPAARKTFLPSVFAALVKGGSYIQTAFQIPNSASDIIQSLILFFVIGSEFFVKYSLVLKKGGTHD